VCWVQSAGTGPAIVGSSNNGIGVQASTTNGTAFQVVGKAVFSRSGIATVNSGSKSVQVTLSGVTVFSMILATVQQSGGFYVKFVVPVSGSFTITINKAPTSPDTVKVAYFVLN
jgi:hypothetical protein